jgi:hypothetical protein
VIYQNGSSEKEFTRVFLNDNQVELLVLLGYEIEDHREEEKN